MDVALAKASLHANGCDRSGVFTGAVSAKQLLTGVMGSATGANLQPLARSALTGHRMGNIFVYIFLYNNFFFLYFICSCVCVLPFASEFLICHDTHGTFALQFTSVMLFYQYQASVYIASGCI